MYRESQLAIGWDEDFSAYYEDLSNEDHTYFFSAREHQRLENSWVLALNSQGPNGLMKQRKDYAESKIVRTENLDEPTPKYIPANKYGKERINRS